MPRARRSLRPVDHHKVRSQPAAAAPDPRTVEDFEKLLADEGMPAELEPTLELIDQHFGGIVPTWDEQVRLLGTARWGAGCVTTGRTASNMERARTLLWSGCLSKEQFDVWSMYCDGAGEAAIARHMGRSRQHIHDHYLGELKTLCGIPTRAYTQREKYRKRKRRRAA